METKCDDLLIASAREPQASTHVVAREPQASTPCVLWRPEAAWRPMTPPGTCASSRKKKEIRRVGKSQIRHTHFGEDGARGVVGVAHGG